MPGYSSYAPVLYKYHGDAKTWSTPRENQRGRGTTPTSALYRSFKPRYLCVLRNPESDELHGWDLMSTEQYEAAKIDHGGVGTMPNYLFVAFSTRQFLLNSPDDLDALHHIAETAARRARLPAYWVSASCMPNPKEVQEDVRAPSPPRSMSTCLGLAC